MNFVEFKKCIKELLILSCPILLGNIGQMLIGLGDVYVSGHYHTNTLAAISVASALFMTFIIPGIGLTSSVVPVLSNYRGEKKSVKKFFGITVIYSLVLSLIFFLLLLGSLPLIKLIPLAKEIQADTIEYLYISSYSIFGIFLFSALKEFLQAHEIVIFPNISMFCAVFLNIYLNFQFVYGNNIIPSLGTAGLAYASLIVRIILAIVTLIYCLRFLKGSIYKGCSKYIKDLLCIGAPISGAMFIEFLGFNIVAILIGSFAPYYTACHNIIISVTSMNYMVPFSVASALSVKTGYSNGARDYLGVKNYTASGITFIVLFDILIILLYLTMGDEIMAIFTSDPKVIQAGSSIMVIVAAFTLFDGIQGMCMGALKGLKKTKQMFVVMFISYILISIPFGCYFAYGLNLNLKGFWLGLALGLFTAAISSIILYSLSYFKIKKLYSNIQDETIPQKV